jgi:manganese/iron transport system substrate-binding protein
MELRKVGHGSCHRGTRAQRGPGARFGAGLLAACVLLGFGCGAAPQKPRGRFRVVTTIGVLADWARQVGGDRVEVTSLLSGNESPHTYEIKPADVKALADARILFRVGLGLEDWLDAAIENSGNKKLAVVDVAGGATGIIAGDAEDKYGNPHIWLDPAYAKAGIENLVKELVKLDPKGESLYRTREAAYFLRLDSLSQAIAAQVESLQDRRFVSFHDAWPYFARRFGLDIVATVEPIPGQEPSAKELARLVDLVRREHIKVITTEPQLPSALPDMLARETGATVVSLDPLATEGGYIAALGANAGAIVAALR